MCDFGRVRKVGFGLVERTLSSPGLQEQCLQIILQGNLSFLQLFLLLDILYRTYTTDSYQDSMRLFSKHILDGRTRPDYVVLESIAGIFKKVTHQMFQQIFLPSILKALLRNPDELTRGDGEGGGGRERGERRIM